MKIQSNARTGIRICLFLLILILLLILLINTIPNPQTNTFSATNIVMESIKAQNSQMPLWKIIGYGIVGILFLLYIILHFIMCRCPQCGSHIPYMNLFVMYCPYCSKSLD